MDAFEKLCADIRNWFTRTKDTIGIPYPDPEFQIVLMPADYPFEGHNFGELIFVSPTILNSGDIGRSIVIHEIASAYFSSYTYPGEWRDVWMMEGFATYLRRDVEEKELFEQFF